MQKHSTFRTKTYLLIIFIGPMMASSLFSLSFVETPQNPSNGIEYTAQKKVSVGTIKGRVTDAETKEPLRGVDIRILDTGHGGITDDKGEFTFEELPVGPYTLEASFPYFLTSLKPDVIVRPDRITSLQIELELAVTKNEIVVEGSTYDWADVRSGSTSIFSSEEVRRTPGAMNELNQIINGQPSVAKIGNQYNGLVVRGGSPFENAYYLDFIRVRNLNHFPVQGSSDGLLSLFNSDLVDNIEFRPGGFSAAYGNVLSSVTDIRLREGNREEFDAQLDLNMAGIGGIIEGPVIKNKGSWLLSFRNSFLGFLRKINILDAVVPEYRDLQGKLNVELSEKHSLSLLFIQGTGYRNWNRRDALDNWDDFYGDINSTQTIAGVNWRYLWGSRGYSETSFSSILNDQSYEFIQTANGQPLFTKNATEREWKLRNKNTLRFNPHHTLIFGLEAGTLSSSYGDNYPSHFDLLGGITPEMSVERDLTGQGIEIFLEHSWNPSCLFSLTAGFRSAYFSPTKNLTLSPRLLFSLNLSSKTTVNTAFGIHHQHLPLNLLAQNNGADRLKDPQSLQGNLSLHHMFAGDIHLSVELYYKDYINFPLDPQQPFLFIIDEPAYRFFYYNHETLTNAGNAESFGIEVSLQKKLIENIYGQISGSLYRSRYQDFQGRWWDRVTDNRYNVTVDLGYKPDSRWEFSLRCILVGGAPYTPFKIEESSALSRPIIDTGNINGSRLPDIHVLNLRFDRRFFFKRSNLIFYASVWNVFDTQKPQMYLWNETYNTMTSQISLGRLPVFGLEFEF